MDSDLWFHVQGTSGSHVLLRHPDKIIPEKETVIKAASVAAWFSKARQAKSVWVTYTLAKNVSKDKGFKAGTVFVKKSKKIKLCSWRNAAIRISNSGIIYPAAHLAYPSDFFLFHILNLINFLKYLLLNHKHSEYC